MFLIRRGVKTDQTMVVLVCNENMWRGSKQFCNQLVKKFPSIKTIVLNVNTRRTPIVLGNEDKSSFMEKGLLLMNYVV